MVSAVVSPEAEDLNQHRTRVSDQLGNGEADAEGREATV